MKAKIINKYSIDVIESIEEERASIEFKFKQSLSSLNVKGEVLKVILAKTERTEQEKAIFNAYLELYKSKEQSLVELNSYLPLVLNESEVEFGEYDSSNPYYELEDDVVSQRWEIIHNDPVVINERIEALKRELSDSDYKVTKCYEASLIGSPLQYDINALHCERQQIRDKINELEMIN